MELLEIPPQVSTHASTSDISASEYSERNYSTASQLGERIAEPGDHPSPPFSPPLSPPLSSTYGSGNFNQSRKEWNNKRKQKRKEHLEKARRVVLSSSDYTEFKAAVDDWFANKRPPQFPGVLFIILDKLSEARNKWLQENQDEIPEVLAEAWVSPKPNEAPSYQNTSGIGLWKWLHAVHNSKSTMAKDNKFILIALTGLTSEVMKALLIHYEIKVKSLYEMIYVDSFTAYLHPASENVFALCFDFVRLGAIGDERRFHTQAFPILENSRRNQTLSWKWNAVGSNIKDSDRAFGIARAVVWINRDRRTGKTVAIFYTQPKMSKKMRLHNVAEWSMSRFCDDPHLRTRSPFPIEFPEGGEPSEEIFNFLARYIKEAFRWNRVLSLHHQKIAALEDEAINMPMLETTKDLYRQKSILDTHLTLLSLQKTMISALRNRQVSEAMFWPQNAMLLFGDIEDGLGEKIIEFERMRKQCDDVNNLIFNIISIEESRAAVEQGRSVGRLTWLTFIFLPLSFGASILGMNVFQLNSPGLWLYFALTIPLFILVTGGIMVLKATVLYGQSGQNEQMGFVRWLIAGRPMRSQLNRADLERGNLNDKLAARLGNNRGRGERNGVSNLKEPREAANDKVEKED